MKKPIDRNTRLGELAPGVSYTDLMSGGPWIRGESDPEHLTEETEVFPVEPLEPARLHELAQAGEGAR